MRTLNYLIVFVFFTFLGCGKEAVLGLGQQGDYIANFDFPVQKAAAPVKLVLINRSKNADKFLWEFEEGRLLDKSGQLKESNISETLIPDTVFYNVPGTYKVKLTTWQGEQQQTIEKSIEVYKMAPQIVMPEDIATFMDVQFDANAFEYPDGHNTYSWDFGNGVTSTEKNPVIQYEVQGFYTVRLTVDDGEEILTAERVVEVKGELAKTIYFTDIITRKIYKYKLYKLSPGEVEPTNISTGISPLGLSIANGKVYLSDAGLGLRYSVGDNANGDGFIKYFNLDGSGETILTQRNVVGVTEYNLDPWDHVITSEGDIWWTSRNNGIYRYTGAQGENLAYPSSYEIRPVATNIVGYSTTTHFFGGIKEVNGEIWFSLTGTAGSGIHRYRKDKTYVASITGEIANLGIRQFVVDKVNSHIYLAVNKDNVKAPGIYRCNLDGSNLMEIVTTPSVMGYAAGAVAGTAFSNQGYTGGNANEAIFVTGMDIDVDENGDGYLYFGYRNNKDATGTNAPQTVGTGNDSGIIRYKLGDAPNTYDFLLKGYAPYGLAIDQVKR